MKKYNVLDYGVKRNCEDVQTKQFQAAIDCCYSNGGGIVEVPEGEYVVAGIVLRSNITLYLCENTVLKGSVNPEDYNDWRFTAYETQYPQNDSYTYQAYCDNGSYAFFNRFESSWNNGIIRAYNEQNIAVIGEKNSCIDGKNCFDENGEEFYRGPHAISMHMCENVNLYGYTVKDSGNWANAICDSTNISMKNVTVIAGHDGIHITKCNNVTVSNCNFYTGDDCVAGLGNTNVVVKDCILNTACSAMRFGGTNAYITDCDVYGPAKYLFRGSLTDEEKRNRVVNPTTEHRYNMLSLFTYYCDYSKEIDIPQGNIIINHCKVKNADRFVHYNYSGNETWQNNRPLSSIVFKNTTASNILMPLTLYGDAEEPIDAEFDNVDIAFVKNYKYDAFMYIANYKNIDFKDVKLRGKCKYLIKRWGGGAYINTDGVDCEVIEDNRIADAKEVFYTEAI